MSGSKRDRANKQRKKHAANKAAKFGETPKPTPERFEPSEHPQKFENFADLAELAGECTFVIARLRPTGVKNENGEDQVSVQTLGTGFLAGPYRLMTCAHVVGEDHRDDDMYFFAQRYAGGDYQTFGRFALNKELFIDARTDSAVFYLGDNFYNDQNGVQLKDPSRHLSLSREAMRIGTDAGIVGYPLNNIFFSEDGTSLRLDGLMLRADKGVVNSSYWEADMVHKYNFTMGFNPGNSGGPIMEIATGRVIAIVHGYWSIPINFAMDNMPAGTLEGVNESMDVVSTVRTSYSIGFNSINYVEYEAQHNISFG